jgi:short-subunit dehydrogenase
LELAVATLKVTLITGASTGIGAEFARQFAARGHDLVVVARSADRLDDLAARLRGAHGVKVTVLAMDLSLPTAAGELWQRTNGLGLEIAVLVNNAGFGTHCDVADADPQRLEDAIELNCRTLVGTTTRYLPQMRARGAGTIINVASTAAFQPLPKMAVYGATKAFVLSFTEALWAEERKHGVRVLAVCPGVTDTPFFEVAGDAAVRSASRSAAFGLTRTPQQVVDSTMRALSGRKPSFVDGAANALVARVLTRMLSRRMAMAVSGRLVG